jgi:catechol 2,3-dioxygenase
MNVHGVGHVVLKVRDLDRAAAFYAGVLGLKEVGRLGDRMVFFSATGRNHHDLACLAVGPDAPTPPANAVGLYHVALKVGDTLEELREAKVLLDRHGVAIRQIRDHEVSQSTTPMATWWSSSWTGIPRSGRPIRPRWRRRSR